ncbi:cysteine hydrolase family protein [Rathayibacter sp. CAU 1779]
MPELNLDPSSTALLIMDLQPSITQSLPDAEAFIGRLLSARAAARDAGLTIAYVRVALTGDEAAEVPETNVRFHAAGASGRMDADAPHTQVDPRIAPADGELVVRKRRVGAIGTTDLDAQLRERGIDTLVLTGIATSGVVLSTLRDAADRDYRLVVLEDGCFDSDDEVHRVLTQKVFPKQATVVTVADFVASLQG